MDHRAERPGPLWEGGNVVSESGAINLVNEDAKEGGGIDVRVGLQLRIDVDDEGRGNCGK